MKEIRKHKRAFTLIELLVVVLIIGILAAGAVPQYQKAVEKSRIAEYEVNLKALVQADRVCSLAKGEKCALEELDISLPNCTPMPGYFESCYYTNAILGPGWPGVETEDGTFFTQGQPGRKDVFLCVEGAGATRAICMRWGFTDCDGDFCARP